MPHSIGTIDGKHIALQALFKQCTLFHDYKRFFSIVLMAVCSANYCFTYVDVGNYVKNNDSPVLLNSQIRKDFKERKMNIPEHSNLDGFEDGKLPQVLVGDQIFSLQDVYQRQTDVYFGPFQTSKMDNFSKIINGYMLLSILTGLYSDI